MCSQGCGKPQLLCRVWEGSGEASLTCPRIDAFPFLAGLCWSLSFSAASWIFVSVPGPLSSHHCHRLALWHPFLVSRWTIQSAQGEKAQNTPWERACGEGVTPTCELGDILFLVWWLLDWGSRMGGVWEVGKPKLVKRWRQGKHHELSPQSPCGACGQQAVACCLQPSFL